MYPKGRISHSIHQRLTLLKCSEGALTRRVLGLRPNLVEEEEGEEEGGLYTGRSLHSGTKGKWPGEALWMVLWESALFEMQIPQRAERAGETGVQGSVLLRGGVGGGGGGRREGAEWQHWVY